MSTSNASRKETERTKLMQDKCQTLLTQMLRDDDNKYCVDCDAKGKYTHCLCVYLHIFTYVCATTTDVCTNVSLGRERERGRGG